MKFFFIYILTMTIAKNVVFCQNRDFHNMHPKIHFSRLMPPEMKNPQLFKEDFPYKTLFPIYQKLDKDKLIYTLTYSFGINKVGKVVPFLYHYNDGFYENNKTLFCPIVQYFSHTFNKYSWHPGYQKGKRKLKADTLIKLIIQFSTDKKSIDIYLDMIDDNDIIHIDSISHPVF